MEIFNGFLAKGGSIFIVLMSITSLGIIGTGAEDRFLDVMMPGYAPIRDEQYVCVAIEVVDPGYIIEFLPSATADRTHHMLAYGCNDPMYPPGEPWDCEHAQMCQSKQRILYAWARNAPPLVLPQGVGVPIGKDDGVHYIILQMHYAKKFGGMVYDYSGFRLRVASQQPPNLAGIYLFVPGGEIPGQTKNVYMNATCLYEQNVDVHPFAFRPHTHHLGRIVSAYKYANETWTRIGKGNPQWPQRFYPVEKPVMIKKGDILGAQCVYDSTGRDHATFLGAHGHDEMCNFYMYYYVDAKNRAFMSDFEYCGGNAYEELFAKSYPSEASTRFPPMPEMEESAKQSDMSFGVVEKANWPSAEAKFGQIAGLTFDQHGNLVVFHRADRVWGNLTFDLLNSYQEKSKGAIPEDTVITLAENGSVISKWGSKLFYLPHGIFVDEYGYVWLTDVALHQVFKFDPKHSTTQPLVTLGKQFEPGTDNEHFCKPASVAVAIKEGTVFVADGYCNNRIMKFAADGKFLGSWGEASQDRGYGGYPKLGTFNLPHGLSLDDARRRIFVADRENGRVQIFTYDGTALGQLAQKEFGDSLYGVTYCQTYDTIFSVNGPSFLHPTELRIFAFEGTTQKLMYAWRPQKTVFQRPHALLALKNCSKVFMGEIGPNILWRFDITSTGRRASISEQQKENGIGSISDDHHGHKPNTANDSGQVTDIFVNPIRLQAENTMKLMIILFVAIIIPIIFIVIVCCCMKCSQINREKHRNLLDTGYNKKRGGLFADKFIDRKGFRPLTTEEIDASDESDDSDAEHTLYLAQKKFWHEKCVKECS